MGVERPGAQTPLAYLLGAGIEGFRGAAQKGGSPEQHSVVLLMLVPLDPAFMNTVIYILPVCSAGLTGEMPLALHVILL